jgi:hypothetical protein
VNVGNAEELPATKLAHLPESPNRQTGPQLPYCTTPGLAPKTTRFVRIHYEIISGSGLDSPNRPYSEKDASKHS